MPAEAGDRAKDALWRSLVDLFSCTSCFPPTAYEVPHEQPSQPPVQSLAQSLIPSSFAGLSAHPSVDEEASLLLNFSQPGEQVLIKAVSLNSIKAWQSEA